MEQMEVIEAQQNIVDDGQREEEGIVDAETYGGVRTTVRDPGSNRVENEEAPEETKVIEPSTEEQEESKGGPVEASGTDSTLPGQESLSKESLHEINKAQAKEIEELKALLEEYKRGFAMKMVGQD